MIYNMQYTPSLQTVCICLDRFFHPLFPPSSPPVRWICPVFLYDKTPNPIKTKGFDASPPTALHYMLSVSRLRSVAPITTRSFLSPNNYLTPPSHTITFVLNFKILSVTKPCANSDSNTHRGALFLLRVSFYMDEFVFWVSMFQHKFLFTAGCLSLVLVPLNFPVIWTVIILCLSSKEAYFCLVIV